MNLGLERRRNNLSVKGGLCGFLQKAWWPIKRL